MLRTNRLKVYLIAIASLALIVACSDKGEDPENRAPNITSSSSVDAYVDSVFTYTATASDPDGTTPAIHFENIPSWMDTSGTTITGTPDSTTADTSFTVIAADDFLADTVVVSVNVTEPEPTVSYATSVQPIFNARCGNSGCHLNGDSAGGLRLDSYTLLIQGGVISAGNPNSSTLVQRIEASGGSRMPPTGSALTGTQIQTIRDWIEQGALDN